MIGPTRAYCLTLSLLALPLRTLHAAPLFDGPRQVVPTGLSPMCVCAEDMDLDGRIDIVTPVLNGNAIELHLATGEGDFGPALCVPTPRGPRALAIGDLDGDGWPDLISGNYLARSITSYRNLGGGRFELIDEISVAGAPQSLALGDVNADGHLDLVVADPLSDSMLVYGGNGNGRLHPRRGWTFPVPTAVMIDSFGSPGQKVVVASRFAGAGIVLQDGGRDSLEIASELPYGDLPATASADIDHDGRSDLVMAGRQVLYLRALPGGGWGRPTPLTLPGALEYIYQITPIDLDRDGDTDLVCSTHVSDPVLLINHGADVFRVGSPVMLGNDVRWTAATDVDGDGWPEILAADMPGSGISILRGGPLLGSPYPATLAGFGGTEAATGDFNGDGHDDLALLAAEGDHIYFELGDGRGHLADPSVDPLTRHAGTLRSADLDGDGDKDIILDSGELLRNDGRGALARDFDGDGRIDLACLEGEGCRALFLMNQGNMVFTPAAVGLDGIPIMLASADLDADGDPDLVVNVEPRRQGQERSMVLLFNRAETRVTPLAGFEARADVGRAHLTWSVNDAGRGYTYRVFRQKGNAGPRVSAVDAVFSGQSRYEAVDLAPRDADTRYWLNETRGGGATTWYGPYTVGGDVPSAGLVLAPARPNPFRATTALLYDLPETGPVRADVFDLSGRLLRTLVSAEQAHGPHTVTWDGTTDGGARAVAGVYWVRLTTNGQAVTQKLVLAR